MRVRGGQRVSTRGGGRGGVNRRRGQGRVPGARGGARKSLDYGVVQSQLLPSPTEYQSPATTSAKEAQPSSSGFQQELKKIRTARIADQKNLKKLNASRLLQLREMLMKKEVGRLLLPDAPPSKKRRAASPERQLCQLEAGTPIVPPPLKIQPWKKPQHNNIETMGNESGLEISVTDSDPMRIVQNVEIEFIDNLDLTIPSTSSQVMTPSSRVVISPVVTPGDPFLPCQATPTQQSQLVDFDLECELDNDGIVSNRDIPTFEELRQTLDDFEVNDGSEVDESETNEDIIPFSATNVLKASDYPANLEELNQSDRDRIINMDKQDDEYLQATTDTDKLYFNWKQDRSIFQGVKEEYSGIPGPTFDFDSCSPLAILEKVWDTDIISLIVEQTNIYGRQLLQNPRLKNQARIKNWKDIDESDIWLFFCILILQGIDIRTNENDYWYSKLDVLEMPKFRSLMSYKKFLLIKKCLHFINNNTLSSTSKKDKAAKIRPVINHLNKKFTEMYTPSQEIAIDESLLLWKGRLNFVQKISNKAAGVGLKSYELCESKTGYLWSFRIYTGKDKDNTDIDNTDTDSTNECSSKTSAIVYDLLGPLLHKGHVLYMDNFYNAPLLSRLLKLQKTDTIGTLRLNREFVPNSLKTLKKMIYGSEKLLLVILKT